MIMRQLKRLIAGRSKAGGLDIDTEKRISAILEARHRTASAVLCNLGCGSRAHPSWINVDFHGDGEKVFAWDLRKGIPLPDQCCDAVYSSHVIEHFDRAGAAQFLVECRRVLKAEGILRLVAPDLEGIVRAYLSCLEGAMRGEAEAVDNYEWAVIELLDQLVRHRSGGEMLSYWCREHVPAESYVAQRVGVEYWRARKHCKGRKLEREALEAKNVGEFRLSGEVHQWMYDRYSLSKLLCNCGFTDVKLCTADSSSIEDFEEFFLDMEPNGDIYKPDSFFLEASRP